MKKFLSLILCVLMTLSITSAVYADDDDAAKMREVLTSVRSRIPSTDDFEDFSSNYYDDNGEAVYSFSWSTYSGTESKSMSVTVTASGIITNYYSYDDADAGQEKVGKFSRLPVSEALESAKVLAEKLNPSLAGRLRVESSSNSQYLDSDSYTFNVTHIESGIPVTGDTGSIRIDISGEKIIDFYLTFTDKLSYDSPDGIISEDTAKAAFIEKTGVTPSYRMYYDYNKKERKIFPVYTEAKPDTYINAHSGEAVKTESYYGFYRNYAMKSEQADANDAGGMLSEAEISELDNISGLLSKQESEKLLRSNKLLGITSGYKADSYRLTKTGIQPYSYYCTLDFLNEKEDKYIFVTMDAQSGEIRNYSKSVPYDSKKKYKSEQMKKTADNIFAALAPDKYTQYRYIDDAEAENIFSYVRTVNGIDVTDDVATIAINSEDLSLADYTFIYTDCEFPSLEKLIDKAKICTSFFDAAGYGLLYVPQKSGKNLKSCDNAVLVYAPLTSSVMLDGFTGKRIKFDGTEYSSDEASEYTDISGHYAEEKIKALHRFGIGFSGNSFMPDSEITQKEFAALLHSSIYNYGSELVGENTKYEQIYRNLAGFGIFKKEEISPDSPVSRIAAAKYIIRYLGLEKAAEIDGIYKCPFTDVTEGEGYVTLLCGLNIVNGTGAAEYSPYANLTRAQTAIILYNSIEKKG